MSGRLLAYIWVRSMYRPGLVMSFADAHDSLTASAEAGCEGIDAFTPAKGFQYLCPFTVVY